MEAAAQILQSLRDYSWPLLVFVVAAPIATFVLPSRRTGEENVARLGLVASVIAMVMVMFFLLTEAAHIVQVARYRPAWGFLSVALCASAIAGIGLWLVRQVRQNRTTGSIFDCEKEVDGKRNNKNNAFFLLLGGWMTGAIISIVWLLHISHGN